ncbi:MAG TPA: hypothetical protein ENN52_05775 [Methanofollis liminatans]|uniref:Uncharacterized protein n=1 Tax=Methanofollis liminatans TaxID=2201 RepID=A0A831PMX7_9EURY|nr:hypothetical protein [Methanofollis liminatans]
MGTITAQILVGSPHPYHDGLNLTHQLLLSENSRPAWILSRPPGSMEERPHHGQITWIPGDPHHILEDAFFMIAYHLIQDPTVRALAGKHFDGAGAEHLSLDTAYTDDHLEEIRRCCREIEAWPKLVVSVFRQSSVLSQLAVIEDYPMAIEVCCPVYARRYGPDGAPETEGALR